MQIQPIKSNYSNMKFGMAEKTTAVSQKTLAYIDKHGLEAAVSDLKSQKFRLNVLLWPFLSDALRTNAHAMALAEELAEINHDLNILEPPKENRFIADI